MFEQHRPYEIVKTSGIRKVVREGFGEASFETIDVDGGTSRNVAAVRAHVTNCRMTPPKHIELGSAD